jgi:hypothetical protein
MDKDMKPGHQGKDEMRDAAEGIMKRFASGGKVKKYAAGGAAKVRHKVATQKGSPIKQPMGKKGGK